VNSTKDEASVSGYSVDVGVYTVAGKNGIKEPCLGLIVVSQS
jgi:hypothetical protein